MSILNRQLIFIGDDEFKQFKSNIEEEIKGVVRRINLDETKGNLQVRMELYSHLNQCLKMYRDMDNNIFYSTKVFTGETGSSTNEKK